MPSVSWGRAACIAVRRMPGSAGVDVVPVVFVAGICALYSRVFYARQGKDERRLACALTGLSLP
jgi:hypothetical protein